MVGTRRSVAVAIASAVMAATLGLWVGAKSASHEEPDSSPIELLAATAGNDGRLVIAALDVDVPISSHEFKVTNTTTFGAGGASAGKSVFGPLTVTKRIDGTSPVFMDAVASGIHINDAVVTVYRPDTTKPLVEYQLQNVVVSSLDQSGTKANSEEISFVFGAITITAGGTSECWDLTQSSSC